VLPDLYEPRIRVEGLKTLIHARKGGLSFQAEPSSRTPHLLYTFEPRLAGGLVRPGIKEIEKVSHGRRLFCEALLFSWSHERPGFNPPQNILVPREELAELRADIGSLFRGHPSECTPAQRAPSASLPVPRICRYGATLGLCLEGAKTPFT
jgi:hypothetical protein